MKKKKKPKRKAMTPRQHRLFLEHMSWAECRGKVWALRRGLGPEIADGCLNAAREGLWEAALRFDAGRNAGFKTYAFPLIVGRIKDWSRSQAFFNPRAVKLAAERGVKGATMHSLDAPVQGQDCYTNRARTVADPRAKHPSVSLDAAENIRSMLSMLYAPYSRRIVRLYYVKDLSQGEIAEIIGLSESRICQIHKKALETIRRGLIGKEGTG